MQELQQDWLQPLQASVQDEQFESWQCRQYWSHASQTLDPQRVQQVDSSSEAA